jgi:D-methionine transport system substrate-binding protein
MGSLIKIIAIAVLTLGLTACGKKTAENQIRVGTIAGPDSALMETACDYAKQHFNLDIEIVEFSDYTMPNLALNDGTIDANMFQHQPYLDETIKQRHFNLVAIGKTFIFPMGIYSHKIKTLSALGENALVAVPNDPTNEARALLLLQKAGIVRLKKGASVEATPQDIVENSHHVTIKEIDAAQLPRILPDVDLAVINSNYAIPAGLVPTVDALLTESADSLYANIVAARTQNKDDARLKKLMLALHSDAVLKKAAELFKGQAIAAWTSNK